MPSSCMSTISMGSSSTASLSNSNSVSSLSSLSSAELLDSRSSSFAFSPSVYLTIHKKATKERCRDGFGNSPKMIQLYRFWNTFLVDKFNEPMYRSFMRMAEEDASCGASHGIDMLFSFYFKRLSKHFDAGLLSEFETLSHKLLDYMSHWQGMFLLLSLYSKGFIPHEHASWDPDTVKYMMRQVKAVACCHGSRGTRTGRKEKGDEEEGQQEEEDAGGRHIRMAMLAAGARRTRKKGVGRVFADSASPMLPTAASDDKDVDKQQSKKDPSHNHWQHRPSQKLKHGREKQQLQLMQQLRTKLWTQNQHEQEAVANLHGLPSRLGELLGD